MIGDLNLPKMGIFQRELDYHFSGLLVGSIGVDVIFADLAFEGLNSTFFDQSAVTVDRIA